MDRGDSHVLDTFSEQEQKQNKKIFYQESESAYPKNTTVGTGPESQTVPLNTSHERLTSTTSSVQQDVHSKVPSLSQMARGQGSVIQQRPQTARVTEKTQVPAAATHVTHSVHTNRPQGSQGLSSHVDLSSSSRKSRIRGLNNSYGHQKEYNSTQNHNHTQLIDHRNIYAHVEEPNHVINKSYNESSDSAYNDENVDENESDSYIENEDDEDDQDYQDETKADNSSGSISEGMAVSSPVPLPLPSGISPHISQNRSENAFKPRYRSQRRRRNFESSLQAAMYQQQYQSQPRPDLVSYAYGPSNSQTQGHQTHPISSSQISTISNMSQFPQTQSNMQSPSLQNSHGEIQYQQWSPPITGAEQFYEISRHEPLRSDSATVHSYNSVEQIPYKRHRGNQNTDGRVPIRHMAGKHLAWSKEGSYDLYQAPYMYEYDSMNSSGTRHNTPTSNGSQGINGSSILPNSNNIPVMQMGGAILEPVPIAANSSNVPQHEELLVPKLRRDRRIASGRIDKPNRPRQRAVPDHEISLNYEYQYPPPPMRSADHYEDVDRYAPEQDLSQWTDPYDNQYKYQMPMMQIPPLPPPLPSYPYNNGMHISNIPGMPIGASNIHIPPGQHIPAGMRNHSMNMYTAANSMRPQQTQAQLEIKGDLMNMTRDWSAKEKKNGRRLVNFERNQIGVVVQLSFQAIKPSEYQEHMNVISCIWNESTDQYVLTSVDCVSLLEYIINQKFSVEEKNRIRRNLEVCKPETVSKSKPDLVPFFQLIMGFSHPRPRNIEKGVKVFLWENLESALKKIVSKYSVSWATGR